MPRKGEKTKITKAPVVRPPSGELTRHGRRIALTYFAKKVGGKSAMVDILRGQAHLDEVRAFIEHWDELKKSERGTLSLDDICDRTDIDPSFIVGQLATALHRRGLDAAAVLVGLWAPEVLERTARVAVEGGAEAHKDRKLFLQTARLAPVPTRSNQFAFMLGQGGQSAKAGGKSVDDEEDEAEGTAAPTPGLPALEQDNVDDPHQLTGSDDS